MENKAAKYAVTLIREGRISRLGTRSAAIMYGVTVPQIHEAAGCSSGKNCKGGGCRLRFYSEKR